MMLKQAYCAATLLHARKLKICALKLHCTASLSHAPNAPIRLDPSLQALLRDADTALHKYKLRGDPIERRSISRELEVMDFDEEWPGHELLLEPEAKPTVRKSAEAAFGSGRIGSVELPSELQASVERVILKGDKSRLHEDAKRLFLSAGSNLWHTNYDCKYMSRQQAARHAERNATAFAATAFPAHYAVIRAILQELKDRLGPDSGVNKIIDWGSGTGSGLWATMHTFQKPPEEKVEDSTDSLQLSRSTISEYHCIEDRRELSDMGKKLLEASDLGQTKVRWSKGLSSNEMLNFEGVGSLVLAAFHLSTLQSHIERKAFIKRLWNLNTDVIVLVDSDSDIGFSSIIEAREQLLKLGKKEKNEVAAQSAIDLGCHVVAPCPHDGLCPIYHSSKRNVKCAFSQRLQRAAFIRKTKQVKRGHEDVGYSYVIIKRGHRPGLENGSSSMSKEGLALDENSIKQMHSDSYRWPRLVFPPLKRNGHVVLDGCTSEGRIMRMIVPRSQGKQQYYDARKASWGDIFPHAPKNPPQPRFEPSKIAKSTRPRSLLEGDASTNRRNDTDSQE